jgi:membrane-bound serine protease (ClpP class)
MPVEVGQKGVSLSQLRPAGKAKFGGLRLDVVSGGELIEADREIVVEVVEGNRIVVKEIPKPKNTR